MHSTQCSPKLASIDVRCPHDCDTSCRDFSYFDSLFTMRRLTTERCILSGVVTRCGSHDFWALGRAIWPRKVVPNRQMSLKQATFGRRLQNSRYADTLYVSHGSRQTVYHSEAAAYLVLS